MKLEVGKTYKNKRGLDVEVIDKIEHQLGQPRYRYVGLVHTAAGRTYTQHFDRNGASVGPTEDLVEQPEPKRGIWGKNGCKFYVVAMSCNHHEDFKDRGICVLPCDGHDLERHTIGWFDTATYIGPLPEDM